MSVYKLRALPTIGVINNSFTNCPNTDRYKPINVSPLRNELVKTNVVDKWNNNYVKDFESSLVSLRETFGTDFISIDGKALDFAKKEKFETYFDQIIPAIEEQNKKYLSFVDTLIEKTEEVNKYLDNLKENHMKYQEKKKELSKLNAKLRRLEAQAQAAYLDPDGQHELNYLDRKISKLKSEISNKKYIVNLYERNKIEKPNGSWVLAG